MTLDQLEEKEQAIINQIDDQQLAEQLIRMGILLGEEIKIERIAPLSDPILISSGSCSISIRKDDAKKIIVSKI